MFKQVQPPRYGWLYAASLAVSVSLVALILLLGSEPIHAHKCYYPPISEAMERATAIFKGEIVAIHEIETELSGGFPYRIEFRVNAVWKGPAYETMFVHTFRLSEAWGYPFSMDIGEYIVYASEEPESLWVDLCSRVSSASDWQEDLEFLGEGLKPEPGSGTPAQTVPVSPTWTALREVTPTPSSTSVSTPTPMMQNGFEATGGGCNLLARSSHTDFGALPLGLVAGMAWFGFRRRKR